MSKVILTVGLSNSGKSSWAVNYCTVNKNSVNLCRDYYRYGILQNMQGKFHFSCIEAQVDQWMYRDIVEAIQSGNDIVISDTNLNPKVREMWLEIARQYNIQIEYVIFNSYFQSLFYGERRYLLHSQPDYVLEKQFNRFTALLSEPPVQGVQYTIV